MIDRTYSKAYLDRAGALRDVHAVICREARRYTPGRVLVVVQQATEDALPKIGLLPVNVELAHHNAVAGRDEWGAGPDRVGVVALIVVGRTAPSPVAVEQIAEALTGVAIERLSGWYAKTDATRELSSGAMEAAEADRHPHPVAEAIRWQIAEGELVQIIGRARGVNRTEDDPVDVLVMVNSPLPLPVNETLAASDLTPGPDDLMLAAGGVAFANPTDAAVAYPSLWLTRKAAKSAFERAERLGTKTEQLASFPNKELLFRKRGQLAAKCPQPLAGDDGSVCGVEYQLAEARRSWSVAWHDPALVPDLAAWLTERVGPLAWCGSPPQRGPGPNVVDAMAARGLILNSARHAAAMYPDLFLSRDAAKKSIARALAGRRVRDLECAARLSCCARYQVAGAGNAPAEVWAAPDRLATLLADLEAALGVLATFNVRPPPAKEIAAMPDADKLAIRAALQGGKSTPDGSPPEILGGYGEPLPPHCSRKSGDIQSKIQCAPDWTFGRCWPTAT